MKGLLVKDFYTMIKQTKLFFLLIAIFALFQSSGLGPFAIIYSSMLTMTSLGFDERSKWNSLAAMMPYSARDLVLSKYILGWLSVGFATVMSIVGVVIMSLTGQGDMSITLNLTVLAVIVLFALIIQAVNLPLMFKLGVQKGRYVFIALSMVLVVAVMSFVGLDQVENLEKISWNLPLLISAVVVGTVIINIISILISVKVYENEEN